MNLKFSVNEYLLIWNLLFKKSLSKELNNRKQKIWINYKNEYNSLQEELENILVDVRNYIPTDDTLYNIFKEEEVYQDFLDSTIDYKKKLTKEYDSHKKKIIKEFKNIMRLSDIDYEIFVVDKMFGVVEYSDTSEKSICYGKNFDNFLEVIIDITYHILKKEVTLCFKGQDIDKNISDIVIDLAVNNEYRMRLLDKKYTTDVSSGLNLEVYSYFVKYLEDKEYRKMNIFEFIKYCSDKVSISDVQVIEEL